MPSSIRDPDENDRAGGANGDERLRLTIQGRYRILFEENPMPMWVFDVKTLRFLDVNDAAIRHYGYTRQEFLSMTIRDIRPPEDVPRLLEEVAKAGSVQHTIGLWRHRKKDGTLIDMEVAAHEFTFDGGLARLVLAHDVTDRMRADRYRAVEYAVTRVLAETRTLGEAAPRLLRAIGEAASWELAELWRVDPDAQVLVWGGGWHSPDPRLERFERESGGLAVARGTGLCGRVWSTGRPSWVPDVAENSFTRRALAAEAGLRAAFAFPVTTRGDVTAIMAFFSRTVHEPDDAFLQMMAELGSRIGQFIERERTDRALQTAEEHLRTVVANAPLVLFQIDPEGIFTLSEGKALEDLGLRPGEVVGRSAFEMYRDVPPILDSLRRGLAGETTTTTVEVAGRFFETIYLPHRDSEARVVGVIGVAVDVTEQKEIERRLIEGERLASLGKTAAYVAHEINTPLTNISLLTATAARRTNDPEILSRLEKINTQRRLTAAFLQDLLGLSRPTMLERVETDLRTVIDGAIDQVAPYVKETVEFRKETGDHPALAAVDPMRLQQVLVNLVKNALQATQEGAVTVRLEEQTNGIAIHVEDSGPGMSKQVLDKLFQPFFTTKPRAQGTGLGLAFAKSIVTAHGGSIEVHSEEGKGSTFTVLLPKGGEP